MAAAKAPSPPAMTVSVTLDGSQTKLSLHFDKSPTNGKYTGQTLDIYFKPQTLCSVRIDDEYHRFGIKFTDPAHAEAWYGARSMKPLFQYEKGWNSVWVYRKYTAAQLEKVIPPAEPPPAHHHKVVKDVKYTNLSRGAEDVVVDLVGKGAEKVKFGFKNVSITPEDRVVEIVGQGVVKVKDRVRKY